MITMTDIENLIDFLERCLNNDTSKISRELLISNKYPIDKNLLDSFGINYNTEGNATKIKLENNRVVIFKSLNDALKHIKTINASLQYIILNENITQNYMLKNIQYFLHIKKILLSSEIIDFDDKLDKNLFLLSTTYGKIDINYLPDSGRSNYYSLSRDLDFETLEQLMNTENFPNFFKDSIAKFLSDKPKRDLYTILTNFDFLISNAKNALSLYQHNFSFEEFERKFDKDLLDYIEKLQDLTSSFHSKVMAIPLQFGVYIYLLSKFQSEYISLIFVVLTLIVWSIFNYFVTSKTYFNVNNLETEIRNKIALIEVESGVTDKKISKPKRCLTKNIGNMKNIIIAYQAFNLILTISIVILFLFFK